MDDPEKRKAAPTTKSNAASQNYQQPANSTKPSDSAQGKYSVIWAASVTPAARKLVLLCLANYSNGDGTSIRPSVATVARHCGLGLTAANAHVRALTATGMLRLVKRATQHTPAEYALNLQKIASSRLSESDTLTNTRLSESDYLESPDYRKTCFRLSESDYNPNHPDEVRGVEGSVPTGSAAAPPPLGTDLGLSAVVDVALFNALVANGPNTKSRIEALVKSANADAAAGHDVNAMLRMAVEGGWKRWPLPPKPTTPPAYKKRSSGRARAFVGASHTGFAAKDYS